MVVFSPSTFHQLGSLDQSNVGSGLFLSICFCFSNAFNPDTAWLTSDISNVLDYIHMQADLFLAPQIGSTKRFNINMVIFVLRIYAFYSLINSYLYQICAASIMEFLKFRGEEPSRCLSVWASSRTSSLFCPDKSFSWHLLRLSFRFWRDWMMHILMYQHSGMLSHRSNQMLQMMSNPPRVIK